MPECCNPSDNMKSPPKTYRCPVNGREYGTVSAKTIMHHIKQPWNWPQKEQGYYFCEDPECEVVYFGEDDSTIVKHALRTPVGIKEPSPQALICYCFGVHLDEAGTDPEAKAFVVEQTKSQTCACEIRNPSGKCCLKDFPRS